MKNLKGFYIFDSDICRSCEHCKIVTLPCEFDSEFCFESIHCDLDPEKIIGGASREEGILSSVPDNCSRLVEVYSSARKS